MRQTNYGMQIYNRQAEFVALRELNVLTYLMPWRKLEFLNRNNTKGNKHEHKSNQRQELAGPLANHKHSSFLSSDGQIQCIASCMGRWHYSGCDSLDCLHHGNLHAGVC